MTIRPAITLPLLVVTAAAMYPALAQTAAVTPQTFAYHTGITLPPNGGPFYQFALPLPVYQGIAHQNLGDLRIFNAQGEAVPYTLIQPQATSISQDKSTSVLVFPVIAPKQTPEGGDVDIALSVQRQADGTLISVKKSQPKDKPSQTGQELVQGAIFDISQIKEQVHALHLQTATSSTPFHAFSIETSDDLQQWHTLLDDAQLVHLQQSGQTIDKDVFEWDGQAGKYLRLIWRDAAQAPAIVAASVLSTQTTTNSAATQWTPAINAQKTEENHYDYAIPGHIPLEKLRIELAQINTLAPVQIQHYLAFTSSRQHQQGRWETLAQTVVYRLQSPKGEVHSPDLQLNGFETNNLRLSVDGNSTGVGNIPPTLQIGFTPETLVFLARGTGPFTLAWGAKSVTDASMMASTLLPGYQPDKPIAATQAGLQPILQIAVTPTSVETTPTQKKTSKLILWGVLAAGLAVLGGMVMALLKQMRQGTSANRNE